MLPQPHISWNVHAEESRQGVCICELGRESINASLHVLFHPLWKKTAQCSHSSMWNMVQGSPCWQLLLVHCCCTFFLPASVVLDSVTKALSDLSTSTLIKVSAVLLLPGQHRAIHLSGEFTDTNFSSGRDASIWHDTQLMPTAKHKNPSQITRNNTSNQSRSARPQPKWRDVNVNKTKLISIKWEAAYRWRRWESEPAEYARKVKSCFEVFTVLNSKVDTNNTLNFVEICQVPRRCLCACVKETLVTLFVHADVTWNYA